MLESSKKSHYERIRCHLRPFFGHKKAHEITTADVKAYIAHRQEEGAKNGSINRELVALKRMFNLAMQAERITKKPYIPLLEENNARKGFFEQAEYEAVLAKLPEHLRPVEHRQHKGLNHRAENSHQPTRERERRLRRFKSPAHAQRFLSAYGVIASHFRPGRYWWRAPAYRQQMAHRFQTWRTVTGRASQSAEANPRYPDGVGFIPLQQVKLTVPSK